MFDFFSHIFIPKLYEIFIISLFFKSSDFGFRSKKGLVLQFLVDILPLGSGSVDPHISAKILRIQRVRILSINPHITVTIKPQSKIINFQPVKLEFLIYPPLNGAVVKFLQEINCLWITTFEKLPLGKRILKIYPLGNTFGNLLWDSAFGYFSGKMPLVYLWKDAFGYICRKMPLGIFVGRCLWVYLWEDTFGYICGKMPMDIFVERCLWYICGKMPLDIFVERCLWVYLWKDAFGYICGKMPLDIFVERCLWVYLWNDAFGYICGKMSLGIFVERCLWVYLWEDAFGYICEKMSLGIYVEIYLW